MLVIYCWRQLNLRTPQIWPRHNRLPEQRIFSSEISSKLIIYLEISTQRSSRLLLEHAATGGFELWLRQTTLDAIAVYGVCFTHMFYTISTHKRSFITPLDVRVFMLWPRTSSVRVRYEGFFCRIIFRYIWFIIVKSNVIHLRFLFLEKLTNKQQ